MNDWSQKNYVKDLSHLMTPQQRKDFYDEPYAWEKDRKDPEVEDMFSLK